MTKDAFVDAFRGKDARDKNPHLRRVIPKAETSDMLYCMIYILSILLIITSVIAFAIIVVTQEWHLLWLCGLAVIGAGGMVLSSAMLGDAKFQHIPIDADELKGYKGKFVYIHWLNNITGYEDEWVPFYGATEQFVRCVGGRPEVCVAPMEQYGRGWVAYAHKVHRLEVDRKERHESV